MKSLLWYFGGVLNYWELKSFLALACSRYSEQSSLVKLLFIGNIHRWEL